MPVINIDLGLGQTSETQKKQLISRLTSEAAENIGLPAEKFITFINEFPLENIGLGGSTVKELKAGR
jgi:4-oxalocrotonate tautomerase family enzyme